MIGSALHALSNAKAQEITIAVILCKYSHEMALAPKLLSRRKKHAHRCLFAPLLALADAKPNAIHLARIELVTFSV